MKRLKYFLIALLGLCVIATLAWAGTVSQKPYGIAFPYWYGYSSGAKSTYYLEHPTLIANDQVVVEGVAQTLANKTLTSPIITGPAISGSATFTGPITNNVLQTAEHGAGAIGTSFAPRTYRRTENGHIITEIHVDLTGLAVVGTAAKDAIGLSAGGAAYIGRYVTATYGIVYRVEMSCIEIPGEGVATITADVDLGAEDTGDTAYDGPVDDVVVNTGGLAAGKVFINNIPALTANDYIYLIEGDTAAATGVYNAGQLIITFFGHAIIS